jgi:5-methylcytosine-specific restriction enzyme A
MPTYLLTWNPRRWPWDDLADVAGRAASGESVPYRWSCGNTKRIVPGDRLFMIKQGEPPRGIIASGWATSAPYLLPHFDPERSERGDEALRVDVDFEHVLNPAIIPPLGTDGLSGSLADVYWSIPASGTEIPHEAADQLEVVWDDYLRTAGQEAAGGPGKPKNVNPDWKRDELILALALYMDRRPSLPSDKDSDVIELSELLNRLPIHAGWEGTDTFRNPNGVSMKLSNFSRFDPDYKGKGLQRGNRLEEVVWDQFAGNREELRRVAEAIRHGYAAREAVPGGVSDEEEEEAFPEGRVLYRLHRARERNKRLVRQAKLKAREKYGKLACSVCSFDFAAFYGDLGEGFLECHHTTPLSELPSGRPTRLSEIALVCSNCHRMIHRKRPWLTVTELGTILNSSRQLW